MILYMTSNQNIGLLDFIQQDGHTLKRFVGNFHLYQFVTRDMRSFAHITRLVVDLSSLRNTEAEIVDALSAFRTLYDARVIIMADGRKPGDAFLSRLFDEGIRNFITSETIEGMRLEILDCLSEEGMCYEDALRYRVREAAALESAVLPAGNWRFNCKGLKVMVAGSTTKTGTTTVALNLAHFLADHGAGTAYLEANENRHIKTLALMDKSIRETDGGGYEHKGVHYYPERLKCRLEYYHFAVIDIGVLEPNAADLFLRGDVRMLCMPGKPYALPGIFEALKLMADSEGSVLVHSTPENLREEFRRIVSNQNRQAFFPGYSPDLFDGNANAAIWSKVMSEYMVAAPDMPDKLYRKKR